MAVIQEEQTGLVEVAIPLPINHPYTYRIPPHLVGRVRRGSRLRVPFRNRTIVGYAVELNPEHEIEEAKEVLDVLDSEPVISDHLLRLAQWVGEYYFSSWGEAISNMVPKVLKIGRRTRSDQVLNLQAAVGMAVPTIQRKKPDPISLNEEQSQALSQLKLHMNADRFSEIFLFGVTGAGKTELYIRATQEALNQGKSAICLVPEIALTEQLQLFFAQHFYDELEILHSKLSDQDRYEAWHRIQREEKRVVLGVRSAVFAPTPHLGLLIMDEEQEGSYKQDQTPRYHAREVARWRARDLGAVFLMGTATPTVETMYQASTGEIKLLSLTKRVENRPMPQVEIVDLKDALPVARRSVIISPRLQQAIECALNTHNSVLIMLNRRGFSTQICCLQCGHVFFCPHCAVALTFHQEELQAICHYCNYHASVPKLCAQCKHPLFKLSGMGTEKVESEVARFFPNAVVARLDADSTRKRGSHEQILAKFRSRQIDILVGTQMIAKGFDFRHVTLVGVINADTGLLLPDFRSGERTFQLLTQVAGRTGRGREPGTVIIQTYSPFHHAIQCAAKHEYMSFFSEELERRRILRYPPFTRLINIVIRGKKESNVQEQAYQLRDQMREITHESNVELIGPAPLPLYRLRGHYRWHLIVRGFNVEGIRCFVQAALKGLRRKTGVYIAIDVDPISLL